MTFNMRTTTWVILLVAMTSQIRSDYVRITSFDLMKCSYGDRGSLTATCVNATPSYFKSTPYRFDQLDETLRCANCTLKTLDNGMFDISGNQIKNLDLRDSLIESIRPSAFVGLIFMENLDLSENHIRSIYPATFHGVKKIKVINLNRNDINILSDDGFLELVNLERLLIDNNLIKTVSSKAFNGLKNLKELDLSFNYIAEIKDVFVNLTTLQVLNLRHNEITTLTGNEFSNLTSLLELNLSVNKITSPVIYFDAPNHLKNLDFSENKITKIVPKAFLQGLHSLETLDLSFNGINEISKRTLQGLFNLHGLNISYNKLTVIQTATYSGLPQLRMLNCSHNYIDDIEITGVFSLNSLYTLDISYNNLTDLDYALLISRLPRLTYLKLENNMLPCALEAEMEEYFNEDNFKYVLYENNVGSPKCVDTPTTKHSYKVLKDSLVQQQDQGLTSTETCVFVLISIILVLVGLLSYLQFRTYQALNYKISLNRTTSTHQLVSPSDLDTADV